MGGESNRVDVRVVSHIIFTFLLEIVTVSVHTAIIVVSTIGAVYSALAVLLGALTCYVAW